PLGAQGLGEQRRLRRLAGPVRSLEGDEHGRLPYAAVRTVVTGGAGFIASHLVDALVGRGDDVVVVDDLSSGTREFVNPAATFVQADIREGIDAAGADAVFHLAAQADVQTSMRRPDYDAAVNVVG